MANRHLVDGLNILGENLKGKCEDFFLLTLSHSTFGGRLAYNPLGVNYTFQTSQTVESFAVFVLTVLLILLPYYVILALVIPTGRRLLLFPFTLATLSPPDDILRVFGAKCWAKIPTVHGVQVTGGSKLDPRSVACRLLGYSSGTGNYKVQDIESRRVFVSRDVVFEEGHLLAPLSMNLSLSLMIPSLPLMPTSISMMVPHELLRNRLNVTVLSPKSLVDQLGRLNLRRLEFSQKRPKAFAATDWSTPQADLDDFIACLAETKASHNIPKSYRHAMATDHGIL